MKYFVIGDKYTVIGFSLIGIRGEVPQAKEKVVEIFNRIIEDKTIGIIIITEQFAELIEQKIGKHTYEYNNPLISIIPDYNGPKPGRKDLRQIIRESVGLTV